MRWRQVGSIGFIEFVEFVEFMQFIETGDWRFETREQAQMTKPKWQSPRQDLQKLKCQIKPKIQRTNRTARPGEAQMTKSK
jgi:hypothetical protein